MEIDSCLSLIRRHFSDLEIRDVKPDSGGLENFVLAVNGEMIFRFPLPHAELSSQKKEIAVLPLLARTVSFAVPQYEKVVWSEDRSRILMFAYRKIQGVALTKENLLSLDTERLVREVARLLDELACVPVKPIRKAGIPVERAWSLRPGAYLYYLLYRRKAPHRLEPAIRRRTDLFWKRFLRDRQHFTGTPVLSHLDLCPHHIRVDPASSSVTGVIDWSTVKIADPALDLARLVRWHGSEIGYRIHQATARAGDDAFWRRAVYYAAFVISSLRPERVLDLFQQDGRVHAEAAV